MKDHFVVKNLSILVQEKIYYEVKFWKVHDLYIY